MPKAEVEMVAGYFPGIIGWVTQAHGQYYARHWGLAAPFECKVAAELAKLVEGWQEGRDGLWCAKVEGRPAGAVAIDGGRAGGEGARLRFFIVPEEYQGLGLGRRLLDEALGFCRRAGFPQVFLHTFAGLDAAARLYQEAGFVKESEEAGEMWGRRLQEQTWTLKL